MGRILKSLVRLMETISDFVKGTGEKIIIGKYEVRKLKDGNYYIEHESGEGMGISSEHLEKFFDLFYQEMF